MYRLTDEERIQEHNEGRLEAKIETAKKMILKGFSIKDIIDITGLSKEEIMSFYPNA